MVSQNHQQHLLKSKDKISFTVRDYKADTRTDLKTGEVTPTGLPSSNVLYYELSNHAWCCVRPSGTEPKIKVYYGVKGVSLTDAKDKSEQLKQGVSTLVR